MSVPGSRRSWKEDNEAGFLGVSPFTSMADRVCGHTPLELSLVFPLTYLKITWTGTVM